MDNIYKGEDITEQAVSRIVATEIHALATLRGDTKLAKIALQIDFLKRDRGISHQDAFSLVKLNHPDLFR